MNGLTNIPTIEIVFKRSEKSGLGFNVVGGSDANHIPGNPGIFVSKIRPDSPAADDGRLSVGDRILKVNEIDLTGRTHDQAVEVFRGIQDECRMIVEPDAERIFLSQPSNLIMAPNCSSPTSHTARLKHGSRSGSPRNSRPGSPTGSRSGSPTRSARPGSPPRNSPVPSVVSVLDDIPRTPKKPVSVLDPSNPSAIAETLFLSIGTVALGIGLFFVYRFLRRR